MKCVWMAWKSIKYWCIKNMSKVYLIPCPILIVSKVYQSSVRGVWSIILFSTEYYHGNASQIHMFNNEGVLHFLTSHFLWQHAPFSAMCYRLGPVSSVMNSWMTLFKQYQIFNIYWVLLHLTFQLLPLGNSANILWQRWYGERYFVKINFPTHDYALHLTLLRTCFYLPLKKYSQHNYVFSFIRCRLCTCSQC